MKRIYLDSNVLISLIKSEMGRPFKLMYQKAEDFLYSCRGKYEIVISDLTSREIIDRTYYCKQEIIDFIKKYRIEIIEI